MFSTDFGMMIFSGATSNISSENSVSESGKINFFRREQLSNAPSRIVTVFSATVYSSIFLRKHVISSIFPPSRILYNAFLSVKKLRFFLSMLTEEKLEKSKASSSISSKAGVIFKDVIFVSENALLQIFFKDAPSVSFFRSSKSALQASGAIVST